MSLKEAHESFSSNSRGPVHEDRRLQIEELDEWRTHKPRTPDNPNYAKTSPIPLQINLSIFPFGTVEVSHPKFSTFKAFDVVFMRKKTVVPASKKKKGESSSAGPTTVMTNYDDPGQVQFCLGGLIHQLSVLEFGATLGLYTEEFKEENELHALSHHIHFSPSKCWHTLAPSIASYNPSRFKASILLPSLMYLHAILAHTITGSEDVKLCDILNQRQLLR
ncbi:hypothetical protein GOBAR_AA16265 [Gossypium barbadense]|uniref:Uncharacterized protein n=1 Tax=Gossypium barbadense TaxID=3634 RepID=A0A2P5XM19_GOSBA|nr:hypothetical protein GOBAR_AA16265 [Gossypium barbadense]